MNGGMSVNGPGLGEEGGGMVVEVGRSAGSQGNDVDLLRFQHHVSKGVCKSSTLKGTQRHGAKTSGGI